VGVHGAIAMKTYKNTSFMFASSFCPAARYDGTESMFMELKVGAGLFTKILKSENNDIGKG
jgi:hypothetical protein